MVAPELAELQQSMANPPAEWLKSALEYGKLCIINGLSDDETLKMAQITLDHARQLGNGLELVTALNNMGSLMLGKQLYDAFNQLMEARTLLEAMDQAAHEIQLEKRRTYNALGAVYQNLGDLKNAYLSFEQSLEIARTLQDRTSEARLLNNMGLLLTLQENHIEALSVFQSAETIMREQQEALGLSRTLLNAVGLRLQQYKKNQASITESDLVPIQEALNILELRHNPTLRGLGLCYLAQMDLYLNRIEEAHQTIAQALAYAQQHQVFDIEMFAMQLTAEIQLAEGQHEAAIVQLLKVKLHLEEVGYKENLLEVLAQLVANYKAQGRFEEALACHEEMHHLDREIRSATASKQLEVMIHQRKAEKIQHESELERIRNEELERLVLERTRELESAYLEMLERLAVAAEFRDGDTGDHTFRVGERAAEVAQVLGMTEEEVRVLRMAARLHDVGKIAVSDTILHKPGKLTEDEYGLMKTHTLAGAKMLSDAKSDLIQMAEKIALTHHEKWDGTGYPAGLKGEDIPLEGRIVAVVDVLDALISERPYKNAWSLHDALTEIQAQSGRHFDPVVVEALLKIHGHSRD